MIKNVRENSKGGTPLPRPLQRVRKHEREKKETKRCELFKIINFATSNKII